MPPGPLTPSLTAVARLCSGYYYDLDESYDESDEEEVKTHLRRVTEQPPLKLDTSSEVPAPGGVHVWGGGHSFFIVLFGDRIFIVTFQKCHGIVCQN